MNGETLYRKVRIANPNGFHLRPIAAFARLAGKFQSAVTVVKDDQKVDGKKSLDLMLLGAEEGTELVVEVTGPDAKDALEALAEILAAPSADDILPPKKG